MQQAWYRYRPIKVADGHGGWVETTSGVTPVTVYGTMRIHDAEEVIILEGNADVQVEDLLRLRED